MEAEVREYGKGKETDRWVFLEHVSKSKYLSEGNGKATRGPECQALG